jgi:hypothetical protein
MDTKENKSGLQDPKEKRVSLPRRSLQEILHRGAGSSGVPPRGTGGTSEPAVEFLAKIKEEPTVRNLPEETSKTPVSGLNSSDTIAGN